MPCCSRASRSGRRYPERFATEIRNLQRTEVREVEEPFGAGQKGSSAMPYKRNPILAERICGSPASCAGTRRWAWHRAVARARHLHSGAERWSCPTRRSRSTTCSTSPPAWRRGMTVHTERMRENVEPTHGALFSQRALTALVESGTTRRRLQAGPGERSWAWDEGTSFRELIAAAAPDLDLDAVFDYDAYLEHVPEVMARLEAPARLRACPQGSAPWTGHPRRSSKPDRRSSTAHGRVRRFDRDPLHLRPEEVDGLARARPRSGREGLDEAGYEYGWAKAHPAHQPEVGGR